MQCTLCGNDNPEKAERCLTCGADLADQHESDGDSEPADDATPEEQVVAREIAELLKEGKKVQAVKRYREVTGVELVEAVEAINKLQMKHGFGKPAGCMGSVLVMVLALGIGILGGERVCRASRAWRTNTETNNESSVARTVDSATPVPSASRRK